MRLFDWLLGKKQRGGSGDGSSAAQAIVVNSVRDEYVWVQRHCPGFTLEMQALQQIDGKPYDVLTLRNQQGETRLVYFDISKFFGKY